MKSLKILYHEQGVTLVELLIVMALSLLLMSAVYMAYQTQQRRGEGQQMVVTMQQDLRAVMDVIEKDIRHAGCTTTYSSSDGFAGSNATTLVAQYVNVDTGANESATYTLNGEAVTRNGITLISNCTNLAFQYFNQNGGLALNTVGIRSITVSVTVRTERNDPDSGQPVTRTMSRRVRCRNMELM